jgi:formylglycine-generating enzyme required for sulfatase activity
MRATGFLDFHVMVNKIGDEQGFVVVVGQAPVSQPVQRFDRLGKNGSLEGMMQELKASQLVPDPRGHLSLRWSSSIEGEGEGDRDVLGARSLPYGHELTKIGRALFWLLFPDNSRVHHAFGRSCQCANREGKFLRLRLDLAPELSNLPWELMQWPLTGGWAEEINQARISIVRYLGNIDARNLATEATREPYVVIVKSDPNDLSSGALRHSFQSERLRLEKLFASHSGNVGFEIIESPARFRALRDCIPRLEREGHPVIGFHFIGHGGVDEEGGYLVWEDERLNAERIYEAELRQALDSARSLRWMVFNACNTALQPIGCPLAGLATSMAVLKNVPTVIAYQRPVETGDAEALAGEFYKLAFEGGEAIEDVVRGFQLRYSNPGGLVVLLRSVNGEIQNTLSLAGGIRGTGTAAESPAAPPPAAAPANDPAAARRPAAATVRPARAPQRSAPANLCEMALVPAGPFRKGLTANQIDSLISQFRKNRLSMDLESAREVLREEREEELTLPSFSIDITPVTNAQFRQFVDATGHVTEAEAMSSRQHWRLYDQPDKRDHPVVFVSYNDAMAFCDWAGKRLPSADEWKKACRGPDSRIYPWGEQFDANLCNTAESSLGWQTTPVERFPGGRSVYRCYDMVGNVEEWTATADRRGSHVILGGSWCMTCQVYGIPVLERFAAPSFYSNEQGFRCVKGPPA